MILGGYGGFDKLEHGTRTIPACFLVSCSDLGMEAGDVPSFWLEHEELHIPQRRGRHFHALLRTQEKGWR